MPGLSTRERLQRAEQGIHKIAPFERDAASVFLKVEGLISLLSRWQEIGLENAKMPQVEIANAQLALQNLANKREGIIKKREQPRAIIDDDDLDPESPTELIVDSLPRVTGSVVFRIDDLHNFLGQWQNDGEGDNRTPYREIENAQKALSELAAAIKNNML